MPMPPMDNTSQAVLFRGAWRRVKRKRNGRSSDREQATLSQTSEMAYSFCISFLDSEIAVPYSCSVVRRYRCHTLFEVCTPVSIASLEPLPQILSGRQVSGPRRHTRQASFCC